MVFRFDPSIYSNYAAQIGATNRALGEQLGQAAEMVQRAQMQRQANLEQRRRDELERQGKKELAQLEIAEQIRKEEIKAQEQALMPESILSKRLQFGMDSLTPEEKASFEAYETLEGAKRRVDHLGYEYSPYKPIGLEQSKISQQLQPMQPEMAGYSDILQPPNVQQETPSPIGSRPEKTFDSSRVAMSPKVQAEIEKEKAILSLRRGEKQHQERKTDDFSFMNLKYQIENVEDSIDKVLEMASPRTVGFLGTLTKAIPGTKADTVQQELNTILSDAALGRLVQLKKEGGTLGAVSEKELDLLKSGQAALSQSLNEEDFKRNLLKYKKARRQSFRNVANLYKDKYGAFPKFYNPKGARLKFNPETGELE